MLSSRSFIYVHIMGCSIYQM